MAWCTDFSSFFLDVVVVVAGNSNRYLLCRAFNYLFMNSENFGFENEPENTPRHKKKHAKEEEEEEKINHTKGITIIRLLSIRLPIIYLAEARNSYTIK